MNGSRLAIAHAIHENVTDRRETANVERVAAHAAAAALTRAHGHAGNARDHLTEIRNRALPDLLLGDHIYDLRCILNRRRDASHAGFRRVGVARLRASAALDVDLLQIDVSLLSVGRPCQRRRQRNKRKQPERGLHRSSHGGPDRILCFIFPAHLKYSLNVFVMARYREANPGRN